MAQYYHDIETGQGEKFSLSVTVQYEDGTAFDLTNYSIRGKVKKNYKSTSVIATFTGTVTSAVDGEFEISLSSAITAAIAAGRYTYDVELYTTADADVIQIIGGRFTLIPEITT